MKVEQAVERLETLDAPSGSRAEKDRAKQEAFNIVLLTASAKVKAAYDAAMERLA